MYKKSLRLAMIATALSFAVGAAHAAGPDTAPNGAPQGWHHDGDWHPGGDRHHPDHHHHRHGGPIELLKQVHDQLHLSSAQEQQYQSLLATAKQNREAGFKNRKQVFEQLKGQHDQAIINFGALEQAREQVEHQNAELREQTGHAFVAFYNGLNDQQKTIVSAVANARFDKFAKFEHRREEMKQKWEAKHGASGAAAPAPAPAPAQ